MKKKNKFLKSSLALISILALAGLTFGIVALIWKYIYEHTWLIIGISAFVLILLGFAGTITFKVIKAKIKDIFN